MSKAPVTPTTRRRRLVVDLLLFLVLLALLAFLFLSGKNPCLSERHAVACTQAINLYGPGEVLARAEDEYQIIYLLQDGDSYALCQLVHPTGPFWMRGTLSSVSRDRSYPMTVLPTPKYLLVIVNDPNITEVEVLCYDYSGDGFQTLSLTEPTAEDCYLFHYPSQQSAYQFSSDGFGFLLRGYDQAGELVFQSAVPDHWTEQWNLTIPEGK